MKIAVIQTNTVLDYQENLAQIQKLISEAKFKGAEAMFLPEVFYSMSDGEKPTPHLVEMGNEHYENIKNLAIKNKVALLGGSVACLHEGKIVNRALFFDEEGRDLGHYDKVHLFACDLPEKKISEANVYTPGSEYKKIDYKNLSIGAGICFDVRFSEQALHYRNLGANVLTYSAAFTVPTGKAHWHTLLKARAIESQCYVVAAAQWGYHNSKIQTFGHSLIVDPWGEILADAKEGLGVGIAQIDIDKMNFIRSQVLMGRN